jgi:hypothetical protein
MTTETLKNEGEVVNGQEETVRILSVIQRQLTDD